MRNTTTATIEKLANDHARAFTHAFYQVNDGEFERLPELEDDYNQIDGFINNGPKPSILEELRELQHKSAETAPDKPGRSPEINR